MPSKNLYACNAANMPPTLPPAPQAPAMRTLNKVSHKLAKIMPNLRPIRSLSTPKTNMPTSVPANASELYSLLKFFKRSASPLYLFIIDKIVFVGPLLALTEGQRFSDIVSGLAVCGVIAKISCATRIHTVTVAKQGCTTGKDQCDRA